MIGMSDSDSQRRLFIMSVIVVIAGIVGVSIEIASKIMGSKSVEGQITVNSHSVQRVVEESSRDSNWIPVFFILAIIFALFVGFFIICESNTYVDMATKSMCYKTVVKFYQSNKFEVCEKSIHDLVDLAKEDSRYSYCVKSLINDMHRLKTVDKLQTCCTSTSFAVLYYFLIKRGQVFVSRGIESDAHVYLKEIRDLYKTYKKSYGKDKALEMVNNELNTSVIITEGVMENIQRTTEYFYNHHGVVV